MSSSIEKNINEARAQGVISFHMPGHKNNLEKFDFLKASIGAFDSTEIKGLDNLQAPKEFLRDLLQRISKLYGASSSFISVNGSTCSVLSSIFALTNRGDHVLIQRNSHKSVYNAVMLRGLCPKYIVPEHINDFNIYGSVNPSKVEKMLKDDPKISLVVITSPSYEGIISDLKSISEIVHKHGAKLLVDSAHGSHLGFRHGFPETAVKEGADIVVMSLHKTMPSINPCSLIHVNNTQYLENVQKFLNMFQTSSPSYVALYCIEKLVELLENNRNIIFDDFENEIKLFSGVVQDFENIKILNYKNKYDKNKIFAFDPSKILVNFGDLGGNNLEEFIIEDNLIEPEYIEDNQALFMLGPGDNAFSIATLITMLKDADLEVIQEESKMHDELALLPELKFNPYEIDGKTTYYEKLSNCEGKIVAEKIYNYPPGTPIIVEGEIMSKEVLKHLEECKNLGINTLSDTGKFPEEILCVKV